MIIMKSLVCLRRIAMLAFTLLICIGISAADNKKDKKATPLNYEIEGAGVGKQGTYLVKITVIQKKSKTDPNMIKKWAIHGVLFKGFTGKNTRQKALAGNAMAEKQHQDYFDIFFQEGGAYLGFANMAGEGVSVVKQGKQYRVSTIVSVLKDALYQELVSAGVIRGLNIGF